jgi:hypothetical protein
MNKWSACGIDEHSSKVQNNLVSWEAYRALSLSGIQPQMIELNPNHIFGNVAQHLPQIHFYF